MKKTLMCALAVLLMAGVSAEAKKNKGPKKGPHGEMEQVGGRKKSKNVIKTSEEMKQAVAAKKEAKIKAREAGEKMDKEEKSWWKFWKK